ncbi:UDP-4-amino-4,6-dideoxy-N-acetyl-beta-L-altrosamine transaminase [Salibacter halophilus]|uniref:UDP-4-amino-4, 6-dideoxy-N-acetyl-beta-L-altrosamine transaminase n=1 Tax=Salibacter halophilus TaxID=1803916 RepID=A0A6N6M5L1_9FLAO|nr:UDP-4-amino-4,6-dideoxy-N-acetyl-beta-L-altrosamine transaminase [Salibacter halophilus]KAB1063531.1 UDP-4-amino-4,6-dideoxy-N-acetyl-beta-L-altrosamine transaminase [Salibacter halophilus]
MSKRNNYLEQEPKANSQQPSAIPYGKQNITQDDIDAVVEVLRSDYLTQGPKVKEFEEAFAEYVGSEYAVAVSNGTAALHLNCIVLGVKPGDKVITTPITFAASANCVRYCGGEVVFADINPETYLLDIDEVRKQLEADDDIVGIIPVDFAGRCVDMESFRQLADEFDCWIIEDACHAPGGFFENKGGEIVRAGSGRYADLAIFSFHPVKHIASGEGGMITTNDKELYEKLLELRTHGITKDSAKFQNEKQFAASQLRDSNIENRKSNSEWPGWYMEMQALGYNYRISDINCALGLSQLKRADEGLRNRHEIASCYYEAFKNLPQITDRNSQFELRTSNFELRKTKIGHAHHLYIIEVEDRLGLYNHLRENNIFAQIHYIPCHLMPYYRELGWKYGDMPNAENYYSGCISLPMYPTLSEGEQDFIIEAIDKFLNV